MPFPDVTLAVKYVGKRRGITQGLDKIIRLYGVGF
jgi:hypothetical protein